MAKINPATALKAPAEWHERISFELGDPVIPENAPIETRMEIEAQQERHKTFARVLRRLMIAKAK